MSAETILFSASVFAVRGALLTRKNLPSDFTLLRFDNKLMETLFFRNIANNRGALATMMHEAEVQEEREVLLAFFFLHFRWLGKDENDADRGFVKREEGAAMHRAALNFEIEEWLKAVTDVEVDFVSRNFSCLLVVIE